MADKLKLSLAALILGGALAAFYYFADHSILLRVIGLLLAVGLAAAIAYRTQTGTEVAAFSRGALLEVRKVVWPTGKETSQTTFVVLIMVVLMGLILWLFDLLLGSAVQMLTGQGG
jgi:preprotein translocase subunit SecE